MSHFLWHVLGKGVTQLVFAELSLYMPWIVLTRNSLNTKYAEIK